MYKSKYSLNLRCLLNHRWDKQDISRVVSFLEECDMAILERLHMICGIHGIPVLNEEERGRAVWTLINPIKIRKEMLDLCITRAIINNALERGSQPDKR